MSTVAVLLNPAVETLDLQLIESALRLKLKWDDQRIILAFQRYREFLQSILDEPDARHRPSKDVDEVWHMHILHTRKYMQDCNKIFGRYLHHNPQMSGDLCDDDCSGDCSSCDPSCVNEP